MPRAKSIDKLHRDKREGRHWKAKKKKFKIVKSELFKGQEKNLPKDVKKELEKVSKNLAKDPINFPNSMSVFGKPSPEELKRWMSGTKAEKIDLVLEYLHNKECLNKKGKELARQFWEKYIKEDDEKGGKK